MHYILREKIKIPKRKIYSLTYLPSIARNILRFFKSANGYGGAGRLQKGFLEVAFGSGSEFSPDLTNFEQFGSGKTF